MTTASPETESRIAALRARAGSGDPLTLDEIREAVALLRADRMSAHYASAAARKPKAPRVTKAAQAKLDKDALLDDLGLL